MTVTVPVAGMPQINTLEYDANLRRVLLYLIQRMDVLRHLNQSEATGAFMVQMQSPNAGTTNAFSQDRMYWYPDGSNSLFGAMQLTNDTVTGSIVMQATQSTVFADATSRAFAVYLPLANTCPGRVAIIKKIDASANVVTIRPLSTANTVEFTTTYALSAQGDSVILQNDGINKWMVLAKK